MILFKKCPCCGERIFVFNSLVCKYVFNKKCYYCPKCKNQITKEKEIKPDNQYVIYFTIAIFFGLLFTISDEKNRIQILLLFILFLLSINFLWAILVSFFKKLICIKNNSNQKELKRDNSDVWGSDMPFMKMDSIEKENKHKLINFSIGMGGYGLLLFIGLSIIISLIKFLING
jgi:hypothetical protein